MHSFFTTDSLCEQQARLLRKGNSHTWSWDLLSMFPSHQDDFYRMIVVLTILHPYDYSTVLWTVPSTSYSLMSHPVIVREASQYIAVSTTTCVFVYIHWEMTCDEHNSASTAAFLFSLFLFSLFIVLFNIVENWTCCRVLSTERPNGFLLKLIKPATHEPQILHVNKDV